MAFLLVKGPVETHQQYEDELEAAGYDLTKWLNLDADDRKAKLKFVLGAKSRGHL